MKHHAAATPAQVPFWCGFVSLSSWSHQNRAPPVSALRFVYKKSVLNTCPKQARDLLSGKDVVASTARNHAWPAATSLFIALQG